MSESEAIVSSTKFRIAPIWIVPIVAIALGLWLAASAYLGQGPTIEISLENAGGLVENKTLIKLLSVEIGVVTHIRINSELDGVTVTAALDPEARHLLREDSQFWVVKPKVSGTSVSGLGTLLTGAYIELSPGVQPVTRQRAFKGLGRIPAAPAGTPGLRVQLTSNTSGSVSAGNPVLYRGFTVGAVESTDLDVETQRVAYSLFIDAPYDELITSSTRFWSASGLSAELGADGIKVSMTSLLSLLQGGVAFDLPDNSPPGVPVVDNASFRLYPNESSIHQNPHLHFVEYVVEFEESLRGLRRGSPVTYRGIHVGSVQRIMLDAMVTGSIAAAEGPPIPVLIRVEPGRLKLPDTLASAEQMRETVDLAVSNGLRATLSSGNLLTGALYVALEFYPDATPAEQNVVGGFTTIPTTVGGFSGIQAQLNRLLAKLNDLPLENTITSTNAAVGELKLTLSAVRTILENDSTQEIPANLELALAELSRLMQSYSSDSDFQTQLNRTLLEIKNTLDSLQGVADRLADKPNSLVFPSDSVQDPEPKAPR